LSVGVEAHRLSAQTHKDVVEAAVDLAPEVAAARFSDSSAALTAKS
jgi:hypothetical protein